MKRVTAALCIFSLLNVAALQAGPIEKKKSFTNAELLDLSQQQIASFKDVKEVEAGLLGAMSGLINLALYGALLYGGVALGEAISGD